MADGGCSTLTKTLQSTRSRLTVGNDQYRPPVNDETGLSRWQRLSGDVFSMAVLIFYLATAKFPYGRFQSRIKDVTADFEFDTWAELYNDADDEPLSRFEDSATMRTFLTQALRLK